MDCGEGNGNPLQCSCLENPRDGGAWWAAVPGVAQSRTRLKWLSSLADVSLTSTQRRQSFLVVHFPLTIECIPLNPPGRALSPACLHLLQASYINKSISCLTLCLLLNSFCAETQTTWATLSQGIRWVILIKRPWFKSQTGFFEVEVLAMWIWVKTWCDTFQVKEVSMLPHRKF